MDLETRRFAFADVTNKQSVHGDEEEVHIITGKAAADASDVETKVIKFIVDDDKSSLLAFSCFLRGGDSSSPLLDRAVVSKFLNLCCAFDSVECASALVNGEFGAVPVLNDVAESSGMCALHAAAMNQSSRCVEMLLRKKHARTDLKTRDERGLLPLELSLSCAVLDVTWDPNQNSVEDLVVQLCEKDLTVVKLLSEKTKEIGKIAHARAIDGRVVELAALLIVATEKVNQSVSSLDDPDGDSQEKATLFEHVVKHAVALRRRTSTAPSSSSTDASDSQRISGQEKRKLILCEIQLLQLFGCTDHKKAASPLICACRAGDEGVVELLLNGNTDVNDVDADGNTALHWCLKISKESCPQINIMWLLLAHGAHVNQKNYLGLTAAHIAAANGNSQALQVLLLEEPNCLNSKTEMKETPLFFAVKNRFINCAELLLRWGASTDVFNLRRQRPLDLAESQDMRFLLNDTNIRQTRHAFPLKKRHAFWQQGDEEISGTSEKLSPLTDEGSFNDRTCSSATNTKICKYFESPAGCMRGAKCFFSHSDEDRQIKQRTGMIHSPGTQDFVRKVFVGGLPLSVDSDSLRNLFEERYGAVDEAVVIGIQAENGIQSRGFGFVIFKNKASVLEAVSARYVSIMGKHVEIKSAIPRCILLADLHKSPQQHKEEESHTDPAQSEPPVQGDIQEMSSLPGSNEKIEDALLGCKTREEAKVEAMSWVGTLSRGKRLDKCKEQGVSMPPWIKIFMKWLPHFIKKMLKRDGVYALSSLKSDFKAIFGLELDHGSLGYPKLSDFVRTFPDLCHVKHVPRGRWKEPANHMILLPSISVPYQHSKGAAKLCSPSPQATSIDDSGECDSNDINCFKEAPVVSEENEDSSDINCFKEAPVVSEENEDSTDSINAAPPGVTGVPSRFLQFLDPDPIFLARSWSHHQSYGGSADSVTGMSLRGLEKHPVLEALARRKSNPSIFFLREFDFYDNYKASVVQGRCFACSQRRVLWTNFPCLHLLWCADCKPPTTSSNMDHKCVLCDIKVQKIDLISLHNYCRPVLDMANVYDFPTFDPVHSVQEEVCRMRS